MNNFMQSEIFFFISSVGFIVLFALLAIGLFYVIRAFKTWDRILSKFEKNAGAMSDTAKDMVEEVRDSAIFGFLVGKRKRRAKK